MKTILIRTSVFIIIFALGSLSGCKKEPRITGCNSFKYKGHKYEDKYSPFCQFNATGTVIMTFSDKPGTFEVTCTDGCLTSVKLHD